MYDMRILKFIVAADLIGNGGQNAKIMICDCY